ncbi:MAG TPA: tetratricopeptide repeat protein [Verrucomicrobiae bacterium]|nr:tetratricopeptide repeat protein [Verrucomicrobiae bacterium]
MAGLETGVTNQVMPFTIQSGIPVLLMGGLLLAGCASPRTTTAGKTPARAEAAEPAADVLPPEEVDRRAEAHAHYATAIIHELNEEPEKAADELFQAALKDPTNEALVLDVTRRLLQFKKNDKALELLVNATARPDASAALFARLGVVYAIMDKPEQAIEANQTAIRKSPRSFAGYQNIGRLYLQAGKHDEGLKVLDQAAKQTSVDAGFLVDLAEMYTAYSLSSAAQNSAAKSKALEVLDRASKENPSNPLLLQKMGDGFALLGAPEKAEAVYRKLLDRFPNLPGLREKLAEIYLRSQDRTKAAEQLDAIVRNNPTNPQAHYFLGGIAFEEKKWKEAAEHYHRATVVNPAFEPAYYDLALSQVNMNEPTEALKTLDKAKARFKATFTGEFFAGLAYSRMKDFTNAIAHYTSAEVIGRATDTNRLTHIFYYQLGAAFERAGKFEEAEKYLRKCLDISPDFSDAMNYLGYMWAERGVNLKEAREMIERAVKLEPKNGAYLDSLAWVIYKLEQPKEALTWMLKALELSDEPDATLYDHLGDIYSAMKQPAKAEEAWKKAFSIEPKDEFKKKFAPSESSNTGAP